ncbi:MAG: PQQ-binding-like beta-propeller repeat protein [Polyangiaceae bacterium]
MLRTPLVLFAAAALHAGCASAPGTPKKLEPTRPELVTPAASCEAIARPTLAEAAWRPRADALHLLVSGKAAEASQALSTILMDRPTDVGAYALRAAAQSALAREADRGNAERSRTKPFHVAGEAPGSAPRKRKVSKDPKPKLVVTSTSDAGSGDPAWTDRFHFRLPTDLDEAASGALPVREEGISRQMRFEDHSVLVFGDALVVVAPRSGSPVRAFDLHDVASQGSSVLFARVVDRQLVVLFSGDSGGLMAAIDLDDRSLVWRTERGAVDSQSFAVSGSYAFAGSSPEDGGIVTIDLATGQVVDRLPLGFAPQWLTEREGAIQVVDASWFSSASIGGPDALAPARGAGLADAGSEASGDPSLRECQYARALDAIDARDTDRALAEVRAFIEPDDLAARALEGAAQFLGEAKRAPENTTDLSSAPVVALVAPPPSGLSGAAPRALGRAPKITSTKPPPAKKPPPGPQRVQRLPTATLDLEVVPQPQAPSMESVPSPSFQLPSEYGAYGVQRLLAFATPSGSKPSAWNVGVYGDNFIAVLADKRAAHVFDARALRQDGMGVLDVAILGDTLLVAVGGHSTSDDVESYVAGYALDTGALRWRSETRVATTGFVVMGDYAVIASGRSPNEGRVRVLRPDTGETVSTVEASCAITALGWSGRDLLGVCNEGWELFTVER